MRQFEYFLFENFDAEKEAENPQNPRSYLGKDIDAVLSRIAEHPANAYSCHECCDTFGTQLVRKLIDGGVLRTSGGSVLYDCPIFLREDAAVLQTELASGAAGLADLLEGSMTAIRTCCAKIRNGFSEEQNLYHILCGMVFDGYLFEYLSEKGTLATSRQHSTGLDYLTVIYEKCSELQSLSNGLLCSYNRLVNEKGSLQSFGDAQGDRFDFYRFFRLREKGRLPDKFRDAEKIMRDAAGTNKDTLLDEVVSLIRTGQCAPTARELLELFGYVKNGKVCVPVYLPEHQEYILEIAHIVEKCLGEVMADTLIELSDTVDITAVRHGVNRLEIANELYHIVFGSLNEELVKRNIVEVPKCIPGEGRYFKCIEIY